MNGCGSLLTRKLTFTGKTELHVNVDGKLQAEILDEAGCILAKSAAVDCDSTNQALDFGDFDVSSLNGKVIRLRFNLDGKLYAFGFCDETGEFGGARAAGVVK